MMDKAIPTASATVGPFFPPHFFGPLDHNLTVRAAGAPSAQGEKIYVFGRIYEPNKVPRWNVIVELWQADARGRFAHPNDPRSNEADPNFMGWGRRWTDKAGFFDFLTVKPGGYDDPLTGKRRAPHLNIALAGSGLMRRLVTTFFFPDDATNASDPVLAVVPAARRPLVTLKRSDVDRANAPVGVTAYCLDIVLQGEDETPFFVD
jgi:protocatechuate 3,4-dioxygenase alpha subunit